MQAARLVRPSRRLLPSPAVSEQPTARIIAAIVGPTASGKSELGIRLALALDGEIINLDSVQVYRGIQIATAKVPLAERRGVPHHLIDIVEPTENFTRDRIEKQHRDIRRRNGLLPASVGKAVVRRAEN